MKKIQIHLEQRKWATQFKLCVHVFKWHKSHFRQINSFKIVIFSVCIVFPTERKTEHTLLMWYFLQQITAKHTEEMKKKSVVKYIFLSSERSFSFFYARFRHPTSIAQCVCVCIHGYLVWPQSEMLKKKTCERETERERDVKEEKKLLEMFHEIKTWKSTIWKRLLLTTHFWQREIVSRRLDIIFTWAWMYLIEMTGQRLYWPCRLSAFVRCLIAFVSPWKFIPF